MGKNTATGLMNLDNRIAARYVFESRILIRFCRGSQKFAARLGPRPREWVGSFRSREPRDRRTASSVGDCGQG